MNVTNFKYGVPASAGEPFGYGVPASAGKPLVEKPRPESVPPHRTPIAHRLKAGLRTCMLLAVCTVSFFSHATHAAEATPTRHDKLQPLALGEVRWTDGFWADRFELCRTEMIPGMWRLMSGTNYTHYLRNFEIAAGVAEGRSRGAPFNDGDFYKFLEGACATLAVHPDLGLERIVERAIDVIGKAQRADGYLHTPVLIRNRQGDTNAVPFQDRLNFEMYNMGHLMTAASVHRQVTGRTNFLNIALKAAAFLDQAITKSPASGRTGVCPSHYMGLVDLYRATEDARYLDLATRLFEIRNRVEDGTDDNQDRIPFEEQRTAMGHAVRANYLYAGATDLFMQTGERKFWTPLEPIWTNLVQRKMYITGGCGALYDGASPYGSRNQGSITRTHQAYGRDYELPNTTAHAETCANIGNVLWNWRMFLATGEARFFDVAELALYNSVLSGVGLDGTNFFYTNPLRVTDPMPVALRWSRTRVPFVSSFCCPPNIVRTIAESMNYAYAKSGDALSIALYGGSAVKTKLASAGEVEIVQETEYPWNGRVRITVAATEGREFALRLRVPGWTSGATVRINQRPPEGLDAKPSSFIELRRAWKAGDVVDVEFPMPVQVIEANPLVEETLNQVAVRRGPIVYCLESPDLPRGVRLTDVRFPADAVFRVHYDQRLLDGVAVIDTALAALGGEAWENELYRERQTAPARSVRTRLIPYSVWANRAPSEMTVWIPLAAQ